jgi:hypothetical protein
VNKPFSSTSHRAVKSTGTSPSPKSIPTNGNRGMASPSKPAPLKQGCASCGKKR